MINQKKLIINALVIMCIYFSNTLMFSQSFEADPLFYKILKIDEYNNSNFQWEPFGQVKVIDSNRFQCGIRINLTREPSWWFSDSIKIILYNNLKDTTKDFASHVILFHFTSQNCCKLIKDYFKLDSQHKVWRIREKEYWLKYWKEFLKIE